MSRVILPSAGSSYPLDGPELLAVILLLFRVGLDPLFPPPSVTINKGKPFKENFNEMNRFQLVFDSAVEGASIEKLYSGVEIQETMEISEDDEVYEDEGREIEEE